MTTPQLAERLKSETAKLHAAVEGGVFMRQMTQGRVQRLAYCAFLRNLQPIYAALEGAIGRHLQHRLIAPVWHPTLSRSTALGADLNTLHGADWAEALLPTAQALLYVERLKEIDRAEPALLLAHAYVRYLGDLSGGQILRRVVGQGLGLSGEAGLAFYDFGDAATMRALRLNFRRGLASLATDAATSDALVAEATQAFRRHQRLFDELALQQGLRASPDYPAAASHGD